MIIAHRRAPRPVRALATGSAVVMAVALGVSACGRSSNTPSGQGTSSAPASNTSTSAAPSAAPGDFGSLKGVCGSGNASGATARGVTATCRLDAVQRAHRLRDGLSRLNELRGDAGVLQSTKPPRQILPSGSRQCHDIHRSETLRER